MVFFVVAFAGTVIDAQGPEGVGATFAISQAPQKTLIVVAGAAGEKEFGEQFQASAQRWHSAYWPVSTWMLRSKRLGRPRSNAASLPLNAAR